MGKKAIDLDSYVVSDIDNEKTKSLTIFSVYDKAKTKLKYLVNNSDKMRYIRQRKNEITIEKNTASLTQQIALKKEYDSLILEELELKKLIKNINSCIGNINNFKIDRMQMFENKSNGVEFKTKRRILQDKINWCKLSSIQSILYKYRSVNQNYENIDFSSLELNDMENSTVNYYLLLEEISLITNTSIEEINELATNKIIQLLSQYESTLNNKLNNYENELKILLKENANLTASTSSKQKTIDEFFKLYVDNIEIQSEFLVLFSTNYVQMTKSVMIKSIEKVDDFIKSEVECAANFGLVKAINKFLEMRKNDEHIDFFVLAHKYVKNEIHVAIMEYRTGGCMSYNSLAHNTRKKKQTLEIQISEFKKSGVSDDTILSIISDIMEDKTYSLPKNIDTTIISDDFDFFEIFDAGEKNLIFEKENYQNMMHNLEILFSTYELNDEKTKVTNKKVFDIYDRKLFCLMFGFEQNLNSKILKTMTSDTFIQLEMGVELSKFYAANGIKKTFSQELIVYRQKILKQKLLYCYENVLSAKKAINEILNYFSESRTYFEYFNTMTDTENNKNNIEIYTASKQHNTIETTEEFYNPNAELIVKNKQLEVVEIESILEKF